MIEQAGLRLQHKLKKLYVRLMGPPVKAAHQRSPKRYSNEAHQQPCAVTYKLENYRHIKNSIQGPVLTGFFAQCFQYTLAIILPHFILLQDPCAQLFKMFLYLSYFLSPAHSLMFTSFLSFLSSMASLLFFFRGYPVQLSMKHLLNRIDYGQ